MTSRITNTSAFSSTQSCTGRVRIKVPRPIHPGQLFGDKFAWIREWKGWKEECRVSFLRVSMRSVYKCGMWENCAGGNQWCLEEVACSWTNSYAKIREKAWPRTLIWGYLQQFMFILMCEFARKSRTPFLFFFISFYSPKKKRYRFQHALGI